MRVVPEVITTLTKLLEYDDNSYYAIDYTGAMQQLNDSLRLLVENQYYIIALLVVLICIMLVLIFAYVFRSRF